MIVAKIRILAIIALDMAITIRDGDGGMSEDAADAQTQLPKTEKVQTPAGEKATVICPEHLKFTSECKGEANSLICLNFCHIGLRKQGKEF